MFLPLILALLPLSLPAQTAQPASSAPDASGSAALQEVFAGMDKAAAGFTSAAADLEYTKVTVIVNDHSTERGKVHFEKPRRGNLRVMLAFAEPAEKYVLFSGNKVSVYRPKIAEVEEYSLANSQGLMEQFLLLGFGTSAADLRKSYEVVWRGEDTLDGQQVVHLELIPKSPEVAARLAKVELWLSRDTWQPVQQRFTEPSKDYLTARYRDTQLNTRLPGKAFDLPVRGNVRTVRPQGR